MLEHCGAYLVAGTERQTASLYSLAQRVGFTHIIDAQAGAPLRSNGADVHVWYFLVHYLLSDDSKRAILSAVRANTDQEVRFAPVVLIINDCPFETVLTYVKYGFDDIISLPEKPDVMTQRLASQINGTHLYIQTADYLGPDRRRMEVSTDTPDRRRGGGQRSHIRYTIQRDPGRGVEIVQKVLCS